MSLVSRWLLVALVSLGMANGAWAQIIAEDEASNYETDPDEFDWSDGSNQGTGFGPWVFAIDAGDEGFAGAFIGDPTSAGITDLPEPAFGLFANPGPSGASALVIRPFSNALTPGDSFSVQWANNADADVGEKALSLWVGGAEGTEVARVTHESFPGETFFNGSDTGIDYGTSPMTWSFTMISSDTLQVTSTDRANNPEIVFSTNITVSAGPDAVSFSADAMTPGDDRQPYFNHLVIQEVDLMFIEGPTRPTAVGDYTFTLLRGAESSIDDTIILESSNTNAVTVPATVSFEPEATSVSFTGTVVSLVAGSATITAEDPISFTEDTFEVNIPEPSLTITGPDNIFAGQVRTYTLTRTGFEGDVVTLSSDNEDVLTVPATVNFESEDTVTFQATAVDEGVADITATGDFSASPAFTVNVGPEFISDYSDEAFNYPDGTWVDGSNQGANFGPWILQAGGGEFFIGSSTEGTDRPNDVDSEGVAFGMRNDGGEATAAIRTFEDNVWGDGAELTFEYSLRFDAGTRGVTLHDASLAEFGFLTITDAGYDFNGMTNPPTSWEGERENGEVLTFSFEQNGMDLHWSVSGIHPSSPDESGVISNQVLGAFRIFNAAGSSADSGNDLFFNKLDVTAGTPLPTLVIDGPPTVTEGTMATYTLTRSGPVGDDITLASSDASVLSLPLTSVSFAVGEDTLQFDADTVALGSSDLTATADDASSISAPFTVTVVEPSIYSDEAANYGDFNPDWESGSNQGSDLGEWVLVEGDGGFFIESSSEGGERVPDVDTEGVAFGMFNLDEEGTAAIRLMDPAVWGDGASLSFEYSFRFDAGSRGVTLHDDSLDEFAFFTIEANEFNLNGTVEPLTVWEDERENGEILTFTLTQNGADLDWAVSGIHASSPSESGTVTGETLGAVRFFSAAGEGGGGNDIFFNKFIVEEGTPMPTGPEIASFNMLVGGDLQATIDGEAGKSYYLVYTDDLTSITTVNPPVLTEWEVAEFVEDLESDQLVTLTDDEPEDETRFYGILVTDEPLPKPEEPEE